MTFGRELPVDGYTRSGTAGKPVARPRRRGLSHLPSSAPRPQSDDRSSPRSRVPVYLVLLRLERPVCKASQRLGGRHGTADGFLVPVRLDT
jgi:hypothetical protein